MPTCHQMRTIMGGAQEHNALDWNRNECCWNLSSSPSMRRFSLEEELNRLHNKSRIPGTAMRQKVKAEHVQYS